MPNLLKDFPFEIRKAVLIKQAEIKSTKKSEKFSQKNAIVQIIKEWMEFKSKLTA